MSEIKCIADTSAARDLAPAAKAQDPLALWTLQQEHALSQYRTAASLQESEEQHSRLGLQGFRGSRPEQHRPSQHQLSGLKL
eukprot:2511693-Rhodomonas_salina.8